MDYANKSLAEIAKDILQDGIIDADELDKLRKRLRGGGKIDREKADFLFNLNDGVSGKNNSPEWRGFFVGVIAEFLLEDENSPGEIDEEEGKWLIKKIDRDGTIDENEKELLRHLKKKARKMPEFLKEKIKTLKL